MSELTPKDLKDTAPDQCWNPDCCNYSEEHPSCCRESFTDDECEERYQLSDYGKSVATAAVKKYQEWLASQCGPDPCVGCGCEHFEDPCEYQGDCGKYGFHQGQLAQAAKDEAEMDRLRKALEILAKVAEDNSLCPVMWPDKTREMCKTHPKDCAGCLRDWALSEAGKGEA